MEDSVGEEERREQVETMAQAKAHQEEVSATGAVGGGEPAQDGGFLSAMASKIGATMSGTNGSGGEANATAASDGEVGKRHGDGEPEPDEEGGFLSAMASKIGAAMSGANGGSDGDGNVAVGTYEDGDVKEEDHGGRGGGIFHKLMSSSPHASSQASETVETEEEKGQNGAGEAGILSAMASKIGMSMSPANGNGNHSTEEDSKASSGHAVDGSNGEEKAAETNGGGILNTMASKIGMAMSGANGDLDHGGSGVNGKANGDAAVVSKDEEKRDETNGGGGGILSAVASKIGMTVSGANGIGKHSTADDGKTNNGDAVDHSKGEEKEKGHDANGAGIVEQIISNLPSDDQAPDSDEASLLIAIIED